MLKKAEKAKPKKVVKRKGKRPAKKAVAKKPVLEKIPARIATRPGRVAGGTEAEKYIEAVGRRKIAVARVRVFIKGEKGFLINDKNYQNYFPSFEFQKIVTAPMEATGSGEGFKISVKVKGGGKRAQAEAVRHGLSRALVKHNSDFRKQLKKAGFLTRDPRMRERKKFGLKRARRGPQFSKR